MKSLELEVSIWQCTLIFTLFGEGAFGRTFYTCFKHLQVLPYLRHYYKPVFEKRIFPPDIGMLACKILTDKKIWWQRSIKYPLVNKDLGLADKWTNFRAEIVFKGPFVLWILIISMLYINVRIGEHTRSCVAQQSSSSARQTRSARPGPGLDFLPGLAGRVSSLAHICTANCARSSLVSTLEILNLWLWLWKKSYAQKV